MEQQYERLLLKEKTRLLPMEHLFLLHINHIRYRSLYFFQETSVVVISLARLSSVSASTSWLICLRLLLNEDREVLANKAWRPLRKQCMHVSYPCWTESLKNTGVK